MKTHYQVERAPRGTESWEQIKPKVNDLIEAQTLLAAKRIEDREAEGTNQYRIVATTQKVIKG